MLKSGSHTSSNKNTSLSPEGLYFKDSKFKNSESLIWLTLPSLLKVE